MFSLRVSSLLAISLLLLFFAGCNQENDAEENFNDFYQGSPQDFTNTSEVKRNATSAFEFSGGNEQWQCTVSCEPR